MKPPAIVLMCLACSLISTGATYAVISLEKEDRPTKTPAPPVDTAMQDEINHLQLQIAQLNSELVELRDRPGPTPPTDRTDPASQDPALPDSSAKDGHGASTRMSVSEEELERLIEAALAKRDAEPSVDELDRTVADLSGKDDGRRRDAAELLAALAKAGDAKAKEALLAALESTDPDVREDVIEALGGLELVEFLPVFEKAATDESADVRAEVAGALGDLPAGQAGPVLMTMLSDTDADVLRKVADSLGDIRYEPAKSELQLLSRHEDERVALESAVALRRMGEASEAERWVPILGSRLMSTSSTERREALKQLRRMKLESARTYFEQALNDENAAVRKEAEKGLKDLK